MDQSRRQILLGASTLPLSAVLTGCGGGGDTSTTEGTTTLDGSARAQAMAIASTTSAPTIAINSVAAAPLDSVFTAASRLKYFQPDPSRVQVVKNGTGYWVNLSEEVVVGSSIYSRSISLSLQTALSGGIYSLSAPTTNRGTLYVNVLNTGSAASSHYEYVLLANTVTLSIINKTARLIFTNLRGVPTTTQTIGKSVVNLEAGSNLAANGLSLSSSTVSVAFIDQAVTTV
ncbi:MAG TPA: hypothetical protein VFW93_04750 [Aquabacterium sp.]|uniref:hypothetical protein n=1 Tax=Aquabacterium sp. TaxID=1872578 RepID=UPI002E342D8C|nr:hypothetical protein [Aquabacterium sp.]HEX5355499.1 hypothetical protein [Aquabacterium sp.]